MKKKIALLGEVLVDLVVSEDYSVRPVPGGSLFNTARSLAELGARTMLYSYAGNDLWGNYLLDIMRNEGIGCSGLVLSARRKTWLAFARIGADGNASYDFYTQDFTEGIDPGNLPEVGILHFGSIFSLMPANRTVVDAFVRKALELGILVSYDPNFREGFLPDYVRDNLRGAGIVKASIEDLRLAFGVRTPDEGFECLEPYDPVLTIITLAENGVAARLRGGKIVRLPADQVEVVDTIGAGDAFSAGYLYFLSENGIFTAGDLGNTGGDFLPGMLRFAVRMAGEALKVRGASIGKDALDRVKAFFTAGDPPL